jgi:hypothetical protein
MPAQPSTIVGWCLQTCSSSDMQLYISLLVMSSSQCSIIHGHDVWWDPSCMIECLRDAALIHNVMSMLTKATQASKVNISKIDSWHCVSLWRFLA